MRFDKVHELKSIEHALSLANVSARLCAVTEPTPAAVRSCVAQGWDIVHISAHGQPDGTLLLENGSGKSRSLSVDEFVRLMVESHNRASLVVLSACYSDVRQHRLAFIIMSVFFLRRLLFVSRLVVRCWRSRCLV